MSKKLIAYHLEVFLENIESKITMEMECACCSNSFKKYYDNGTDDDLGVFKNYENVKFKFVRDAYKAGWRYSSSRVFDHTAIHCPECHKHRNNKKHFQ